MSVLYGGGSGGGGGGGMLVMMVSGCASFNDNFFNPTPYDVYMSPSETLARYEVKAPAIEVGDKVLVEMDSLDVESLGVKVWEPGEVIEVKNGRYFVKTWFLYDWFDEKEVKRC